MKGKKGCVAPKGNKEGYEPTKASGEYSSKKGK